MPELGITGVTKPLLQAAPIVDAGPPPPVVDAGPPSPPAEAPKGGGCAGCTTTSASVPGGSAIGLALVALAARLRRRRS